MNKAPYREPTIAQMFSGLSLVRDGIPGVFEPDDGHAALSFLVPRMDACLQRHVLSVTREEIKIIDKEELEQIVKSRPTFTEDS